MVLQDFAMNSLSNIRLWCWKMIWTLLFAYLQKIEWNFTNLESNHEVHLRGLMWKEPIIINEKTHNKKKIQC